MKKQLRKNKKLISTTNKRWQKPLLFPHHDTLNTRDISTYPALGE